MKTHCFRREAVARVVRIVGLRPVSDAGGSEHRLTMLDLFDPCLSKDSPTSKPVFKKLSNISFFAESIVC